MISEPIPFDVAAMRVVLVDDPDLDNVEDNKTKIVDQIKAAKAGSNPGENPISVAVDILAKKQSGDPIQEQLGAIHVRISVIVITQIGRS